MFKDNFSHFFKTWGRLYVVTLFFVILASLLFWLDFFRAYEAEIDVLVIGKTEATTTEQVVENFAELSRNLSFYEKVLLRDDRLEDDFIGKTKDERKKLWNKTLLVERSEKSGVLKFKIRKERSEMAKLFVEETVEEIFSSAAFYYNVKTDIDMRRVDGPIVKTIVSSPAVYIFVSILSGIVFTTAFFLLLNVAPSFFVRKKEISFQREEKTAGEKAYPHFNIGESVPLIDPKKFIPLRPTTLSYEIETSTEENKEEEKRIRQEILTPTKKAAAPGNLPVTAAPENANLPIAMEELPFTFESVDEKSENAEEDTPRLEESALNSHENHTSIPEPTVEEYKRRLNELLQGGK